MGVSKPRRVVFSALIVSGLVASGLIASVAPAGAAGAANAPLSAAQIRKLYRPAANVHVMPTRPVAQRISASVSPAAVGNLTYHGGPVMQPTGNSVPIFWLPPTLQNGVSATPGPNYVSLIERYLNDVGGKQLYEVNTQYYQTVNGPTEFIVNRSLQALAVIDTHAYPAAGPGCSGNGVDCLDDAQVRAEVAAVATAHGLPEDRTTEYFVYLAPHESSCFDSVDCFKSDIATSSNFTLCAYHSWFDSGGSRLIYANMPYGAFPAIADGCTKLSSFPNNRDADIEISATSHEQMEAVTDPELDAWYFVNLGGENGDECAYDYGTLGLDGGLANQQWNGNYYVVQREWSNAITGCTQGTTPPPQVNNNFDPLTLKNGWTNAPFGASDAAARLAGGIVSFKGAIATAGTNPVPFTLPPNLRPATNVYVPVDLCNANKGRLFIPPSGVVTVQAQATFADAQCSTALDGASYSLFGPTLLPLQNGWTNAPFGTSNASAKTVNGVVHLKGAIATTGTNTVPLTLPVEFRPTTDVYVSVDLCDANRGRLVLRPSGTVFVQTDGPFSNAQCFTSLDGATYALTASTALTLKNGWTNAPFSTSNAAASSSGGIVHLKGAIATSGANPVPFTLPVELRPATNVLVPVNLCQATNGRLLIQPSGDVTVEAQGAFSNAQCFTSLDGASFAASAAFVSLPLQHGWTNAPFSTRNAAASSLAGIVYLKGAIATSGTSAVPFTLPVSLRPTTAVYVAVDLCGGSNGRLFVATSGVVTVQPETSFADAQCFTSLEGVSYALAATTALTLQNGWTNAPFSTSNAAATAISGVVHFKGAIATSGTNPVAFTLPANLRPTKNVLVNVDLCHARKGDLVIQPDGVVTVEAEGAFADAQCFTSLDGVSFQRSSATALTLQNGWTNGPFGTANAAAKTLNGIVHLKGAIATSGTIATPFTLPAQFRPPSAVFVPIDLCNATKGRLFIPPSGVVTVVASGSFSDAQCFTSLDGAAYAL